MYYHKYPRSIMFLTVNGKSGHYDAILGDWVACYNMRRVNQAWFPITQLLFFSIIGSCSCFSGYFHTTIKDRAVNTISLNREKPPNVCNMLSLISVMSYYSPAQIIPCIIFIIWSRSLSHLARQKIKNQPALLNLLSRDYCNGKFTDFGSAMVAPTGTSLRCYLTCPSTLEEYFSRTPGGGASAQNCFCSCCLECTRTWFSG